MYKSLKKSATIRQNLSVKQSQPARLVVVLLLALLQAEIKD